MLGSATVIAVLVNAVAVDSVTISTKSLVSTKVHVIDVMLETVLFTLLNHLFIIAAVDHVSKAGRSATVLEAFVTVTIPTAVKTKLHMVTAIRVLEYWTGI